MICVLHYYVKADKVKQIIYIADSIPSRSLQNRYYHRGLLPLFIGPTNGTTYGALT